MVGRIIALVSVLALCFASGSAAHELQPTVGDLTVSDGTAELVLRLNLEAFLAGVDLDDIEDTDDAVNAQDYDALRALSAAELTPQVPGLLARWNALPLLQAGETAIPLTTVSVEIPEDLDFEIARQSTWTLDAPLPDGVEEVTVAWPTGGGALVLRQQGVEEGYTGYLAGGDSSPALPIAGGGAQSGWEAFVSYIPVGFDHILPQGLDHILFVLGLFLLSTQLGPLLWQVSLFSLAPPVSPALGGVGWWAGRSVGGGRKFKGSADH